MKTLSRWMPIIAGAVAGGLIAVVIASGSSSTKTVTVTTTRPAQQPAVPASFNNGKGMTINQIYKSASPGVVDIVVTTQGQGQGGFFGGGGAQQTQGEGAGVVYDSKGDILTDEHVVKGASAVKVNFQNGKSYPAKVLGTDPSTDVGVIRVEAPNSELHPIPLADSNRAQVGDPVVPIRRPVRLPEATTAGTVS